MSAVPRRWRILPVAAALLLAIEACTAMRLYDGSKDQAATATQTQLKEAKVTETIDLALENSKKFLTEAERVADLEGEVRKKRAQLAIADSSRSMAEWLRKRWDEQKLLGFKDTRAAHLRLQANVTIEDKITKAAKNRVRVKDSIKKLEDAAKLTKKNHKPVNEFVKDFKSKPLVKRIVTGPICKEITEDSSLLTETNIESFDPNLFDKELKGDVQFDIELLKVEFDRYRENCLKLAKIRSESLRQSEEAIKESALDRAQQERAAAKANRDFLLEKVKKANEQLNTARAALKQAQKTGKSGKSALVKLKEEAGKVGQAAEKVVEFTAKAGLEDLPLNNIKNLAVLLNAVSTGQVDKDAVGKEDSPLAKASLAAAEMPALAEDAIVLLAAGKAPPTNHLILELNHQQILYNRALALSRLWREELDLHEKKIAALQEQARQYREIQYRLCNYATIKAGKEYQGNACVSMSFTKNGKTCTIGPPPAEPDKAPVKIANCVLTNSWHDNYKGSNVPRAKRQLLAALLAHSRALDAQSEVRKIDFQIIDVGHRRIAESNRAAIAAWNNLVSVPVDTLAAYYKSGIKPDTIASATAQLLGLLGIGIGIGVSE